MDVKILITNVDQQCIFYFHVSQQLLGLLSHYKGTLNSKSPMVLDVMDIKKNAT
jgi:hypothetical protein